MPGATLNRRLFALLWPGAATILLGAGLVANPQLLPLTVPFAYPILGLLVLFGGLLCWRFNRSRLFFSLTILFLVERTMFWANGSSPENLILTLLTLLLPLNLGMFGLLKESGIFGIGGLVRSCWILGQGSVALWLLVTQQSQMQRLLERDWIPWLHPIFPYHDPAIILLAIMAIVLAARLWQQPTPQNGGLLWGLILASCGLAGAGGVPATVWFGLAALTLVLATIESFHALAYRDELTGLPGRRALQEALSRLGGHYTIAMVDIDHFKRCNDRYGHDVGDQVLQMVARKLAGVKGGGKPYRFGGEEFAVLFPRRGTEETLPHLEDLRQLIADSSFQIRSWLRPKRKPNQPKPPRAEKRLLQVTVSIGAAQKDKGDKPAAVIKRADQNLYKAKKGGRNQVCA